MFFQEAEEEGKIEDGDGGDDDDDDNDDDDDDDETYVDHRLESYKLCCISQT